VVAAMSQTPSDSPPKLQPGQPAPPFSLPSTLGTTVSLANLLEERKGVVVMFICNHCPYVKAYVPRLVELQREFEGRIAFVGICSNDAETYPDDNFEAMVTATDQWGLNFPYLHDDAQRVARAYGAERTPEVFALDSDGVCRYEGGIDDSWQDAAAVTDRPLREALAAIVDGQTPARATTHAIGCTIKWKSA